MPGISFFSPTVLASFVTAFGALRMIFSRSGDEQRVDDAPLSIAGGLALAYGAFLLFNVFSKTQSSAMPVASLAGQTASSRDSPDGVGEIAYVQGGSATRAGAFRARQSHRRWPVGQITRIVGTVFTSRNQADALNAKAL